MSTPNRTDAGPFKGTDAAHYRGGSRRAELGRTAVWQARLVLLVMINVAQLWILSAAIEAALAGEYGHLVPLVLSSGACWAIGLTIYIWWKPAPPRRGKTGYMARK